MRLNLLSALGLFLAVVSQAAASGVYRYVEPDGTIVYTNVVPDQSKRATRLGTGGGGEKRPRSAAPRTGKVKARPDAVAEYDRWIEDAADRYRIPAPLLKAVIQAVLDEKQRARLADLLDRSGGFWRMGPYR